MSSAIETWFAKCKVYVYQSDFFGGKIKRELISFVTTTELCKSGKLHLVGRTRFFFLFFFFLSSRRWCGEINHGIAPLKFHIEYECGNFKRNLVFRANIFSDLISLFFSQNFAPRARARTHTRVPHRANSERRKITWTPRMWYINDAVIKFYFRFDEWTCQYGMSIKINRWLDKFERVGR